jgi:hypothetical protein
VDTVFTVTNKTNKGAPSAPQQKRRNAMKRFFSSSCTKSIARAMALGTVVAGMMVGSSQQAGAQLLGSDGFSYSPGDLDLVSGYWTDLGTSADDVVVIPGSLTYQCYDNLGDTNPAHPSGGKVFIQGGGDGSRTVPLSAAITSGDFYVSWLVKIVQDDPTATTFRFSSLMFGGGGTYGAEIQLQRQSDGTYRFGIKKSRGPTVIDSAHTINVGTTYLVVVKYGINTEGGACPTTRCSGKYNDLFSLWVNPCPVNGEPAPNASTPTVSPGEDQAIQAVAITQSFFTVGQIELDGLRWGTTWGDVVVSDNSCTSCDTVVSECSTDADCDDASQIGACSTPTCTVTDGIGTCSYPLKASTVECRAKTGACDKAEFCTGSSKDCPTDAAAASSVVCREAEDDCDVADYCDGTSKTCGANYYKVAGTECRASAGVCDVAETCTGSSATCPADAVVASGTECRASAGACDVAESCDGSSATCPADAVVASGTECRASAGACDVAESCDGSSTTCPADAVVASGTECRASAGACDVAESCDGSSATCPADAVVASGTECRASAGVCDVAESCDGLNNACPADAKSTAVCRTAAGACDVAESCDGVSDSCPADEFADAGTVCNPSADSCDVAEVCSGSTVVCPVNGLFAADAIKWHQPLARSGMSEDTDPSAGGTVKKSFKLGSTIPVQIHAFSCSSDVTANSNVSGTVQVFSDALCDGVAEDALTIDSNGVGGGVSGTMVHIDGHLKYNLDSKSLTDDHPVVGCYILRVTVTDTNTGAVASEQVFLQKK